MKKLLIFIVAVAMAVFPYSCSTIKYVPVETKVDSVYVEKIVEHKDTIEIEIPKEVQVFVAKVDSSHLETSVAVSDAWVDSLSILHHRLENKAGNALKKEVVYKDRIIEKKVEVEKEVPVEVEVPVKYVPGYYKWINILFWGLVIFIVIVLYFKFKKFI